MHLKISSVKWRTFCPGRDEIWNENDFFQANTIPEALRAKNADIAIYVIAIGDAVDMAEINGVAGRANEPPDDYVIRVQNGGQITSAADRLTARLCQW